MRTWFLKKNELIGEFCIILSRFSCQVMHLLKSWINTLGSVLDYWFFGFPNDWGWGVSCKTCVGMLMVGLFIPSSKHMLGWHQSCWTWCNYFSKARLSTMSRGFKFGLEGLKIKDDSIKWVRQLGEPEKPRPDALNCQDWCVFFDNFSNFWRQTLPCSSSFTPFARV